MNSTQIEKADNVIAMRTQQLVDANHRADNALDAMMLAKRDVLTHIGVYNSAEESVIEAEANLAAAKRLKARLLEEEAANTNDEIDADGVDHWGHYRKAIAILREMGLDDRAWHDSVKGKYEQRSMKTVTNQQRFDELRTVEHIEKMYAAAEFIWKGSGEAVLTAFAKGWGIEAHELHTIEREKLQRVTTKLNREVIAHCFKVAA